MNEPISYSWPSCRPAAQQQQVQDDNQLGIGDEQLSYQCLQTWVQCLTCEDGQLTIPAESLLLLPAKLPYELLGPCILAAVDSAVAATAPAQHQHTSLRDSRSSSCTAQHTPCSQQQPETSRGKTQQQDSLGIHMYGIDLQEPVAGPLQTCYQAYPLLQQLSLQELNVDAHAAAALACMVQHTSCMSPQTDSSGSGRAAGLRALSLKAVFMCHLAWQSIAKGIAAGCQLQTLRLQECLNTSSLALLAAAIPAGCSCLQELDLSCNALTPAATPSTCSSSHVHSSISADASSSTADQVWASFADVLAQPAPCCPQLQTVVLSRCSLGPAAGAALARMLRAKSRSNLQQLHLAQCAGMGEAALKQLAAAAGSQPSLQLLDLSGTAFTDLCLKALTGQSGSWPWQHQACAQLQELKLAANSSLSGAAVAQLAKLLAVAHGLGELRRLDLSNCPGIGDTGAAALAGSMSSCHCRLEVLNLSGCEVTNDGAAALAAAVAGSTAAAGTPRATTQAALKSPSMHELRLADNQITAAGVQAFATAVQYPSCRLQLLDVSFNWVGPEGVRPLVKAAAAAAAATCATENNSAGDTATQQQQQQQKGTAEVRPGLTIMHECSHDLWRVEAAKAAARAAAAADAAATAAAEAVAAAAAAGSSWDPHGSDQLSVQQHPAAATAHGFANSSYHGAGTAACGGSSMRTHAGSQVEHTLVPQSPLSSNSRRPVSTGSAVWLFNGLYCEPGEAWSPDSPDKAGAAGTPAAEAGNAAAGRGASAAAAGTRFEYAGHGLDRDHVANSSNQGCEGADDGDACSSRSSYVSSAGSLETVDPALLAGNSSYSIDLGAALGFAKDGSGELQSYTDGDDLEQAGDGVSTAAAEAAAAATVAAAVAGTPAFESHAVAARTAAPAASEVADDEVVCASPAQQPYVASVCSPASSSGGCILQEPSFAYQFKDDVLHSPTRYDQQQQEQQQQGTLRGGYAHPDDTQPCDGQRQLKGLLGTQEFTLSSPNPLYFSNSPLASPVAPRKVPGGLNDLQQLPLRLQDQPGGILGAAAAGSNGIGQRSDATAAVPAPEPPAASWSSVDKEAAAAAAAAADTAQTAAGDVSNTVMADPLADIRCAAQQETVTFKPLRSAGSRGVYAALQLRQPISPDRQLAGPTIRAMPPGSPRRRCGLNTPSPASATGTASCSAVARAGESTACPPSAGVSALLQTAASYVPAAAAGGQVISQGHYSAAAVQDQSQEAPAAAAGLAITAAVDSAVKACAAGMDSSRRRSVDAYSPARPAGIVVTSCGSAGSGIGSSRSPMRPVSASKQTRQRVGATSKHGSPMQKQQASPTQQQQQERQKLRSGCQMAGGDLYDQSDTLVREVSLGSCALQTSAASTGRAVSTVSGADSSPTVQQSPVSGSPGVSSAVPKCIPAVSLPGFSKGLELRLQQQQCQHAARQLFGELQGTQRCEVKAVASSGSYWCNLWSLHQSGEGEEMGVGENRAIKRSYALPLVG